MDTEILQYPLHRSEYRWIVRNKQTFKCHFWCHNSLSQAGSDTQAVGLSAVVSSVSPPNILSMVSIRESDCSSCATLGAIPEASSRRQRLLRRTRLGSVPFHSPFASTCCHQPRGLISKRLPFYVVRTQTAKASVNGALMFKGLRSVSSAARTESGQPFL